jgi:tripeptide aminopeptidase
MMIDEKYRKELLERFLRYVQIDTQSDEESKSSPSTEKQKELGRLLVKELQELGISDAEMDEWGYVYGTLEANTKSGDKVLTIGLLAHMDTYFGVKGGPVKPNVIENYDGNDIVLPGDKTQVIKVQENPNLIRCIGHTIITSDGTTLLGADDKAGIAEIMTVLSYLKDHKDFLHPRVRVGFTTDEEVGRGVEHFNVQKFGADFAYTVDGGELGEIEDETFCADSATVEIIGLDVHPGYAKGKMVNAVRAASMLVEALPKNALPETTEGREPYLHPYQIQGDVSKTVIKFLVRAFTSEELKGLERVLEQRAKDVQNAFPGLKVAIKVEESYKNMKEKLDEDPRVVDFALEAARMAQIEPKRKAIRGGTDGARLCFMGLLTPNLFAGGQNFHSVQEWVSLEWMVKSVEMLLCLLKVWAVKGAR